MAALVNKRATLKSSITRISRISKEIPDGTDVFELQATYDRLNELFSNYETVHMSIVETTGKDNLAYEQIEYEDTESLVLATTANLKRAIKALEPQQQNEDSFHSTQSLNQRPNEDFSGLRVPRVAVPEFSGSYLEWPSFRDLFKSLVGDNPKVPNVQKLSYLKKIVVGDTSRIIKNIKITSDNYQAAWDLLEDRFENDRLIVYELLNNIYSIPTATGGSNGIKLILDTTMESLRELKNLNRPIDEYSDWLVFLIVKKLDAQSLEKWNELIGDERDVIEWKKLEEFLNTRFRILEGNKRVDTRQAETSSKQNSSKSACHLSENHPKADKRSDKVTVKCYYCKGGHRAKSCFSFKNKNPSERRRMVESANLCINCLSPSHKLVECASTRNCFKCGLQHHTLLHLDSPRQENQFQAKNSNTRALESTSSSESSVANHLVDHIVDSKKDVLLATAVIVVKCGSGKKVFLKALLDQGSQMSLISTYAAKRLRLAVEPYTGIPLSAAGGERIDTRRGIANFSFVSRINDSQFQTTALLVDTVTQYQHANFEAFPEACRLFPRIELADPEYEDSKRIDVLLAGDVYGQVVLDGVKKFCGILVQNTSLGWILSGQYNSDNCLMPCLNVHQVSLPLEKLLQQFWEIEELQPNPKSLLSVDELACEKPFKLAKDSKELGYSRGLAVSSQLRMENRFDKNPVLKEKYHDFMDQSIQMRHMELVSEEDLQKPPSECFYMPHHAVLRDSSTTSLRVVFNASQKSATGVSLNDLLHTGPKLQTHLFDILIRYRKHFVCYLSDVEKMYRRILVHKKDRDYQRIVWREDPKQPLRTYRMRVVTDGTSSAPFLAIRTVRQLAKDERQKCPLAYEPLMSDMLMDDLVTGNQDVASGIEQIRDINNIFNAGGMRMRKWASNLDAVLQEIPAEDRQTAPIEIGQAEFVKVLGIQWFPTTDSFGFKVRLPPVESTTTKRKFLSHASK